ncbi:caspase family protein [Calothrix sp. FACHB-1219]|uniref:nSTAND1 domain-containing NTPase n=1 Tax=unclassified Calothrix TaxID=2619626 RepID=UPI001685512C|nr:MULTISPECIES: caspase family protein [unclassified Calothrix]MBD2201978.1 caspase family protein [Calothrix sp. FACHB-168]MBD2217014.1 caspase family protein [Calothrix sp. FACHB-1219]
MCPRGVTTSSSIQAQKTIVPKLWLLLVGVNQYQDAELPSLRYSAVDCQVLAEALAVATKEQFPQKEVKIYHDFAQKLPLLSTLKTSLQEIAANVQAIDTVLFYFSGHGILQPNTQEAFLCLADTRKDNLEQTGLPVKELLAQLSKSGAQNQLVWLDACHSGGMTLRGVGETLLNPTPQLVEVLQRNAGKSKGFYALLSCDVNQLSWEFPELGHGVFTYFLTRGLYGDAADAQGVIFADGLYRYVYHQTLQYIDKTNQQLRLINQQKRGKGDKELKREYPLQTPKRIVEGVGELILGKIPAIAESNSVRLALVIEGFIGSQGSRDFSKILVDTGDFELEYLLRSGETTGKDIRHAIQQALGVYYRQVENDGKTKGEGEKPVFANYNNDAFPQPVLDALETSQLNSEVYLHDSQHSLPEAATILLYLRGRLEETPAGEAALLIADDIWLSRSWLKQQLRRSQINQQIIILDFPVVATNVSSLQEWVEDLRLESEKGQCIIAGTSPKDNPEFFAQTLIATLKAANQQAGLSVAGWITQLQVQLAAQTQRNSFLPLHFWLSGTQGVIEIIPAITGARSQKKSALDLRICPYRGLKAFAAEDAQYFFGRESLTQHLISQIAHKSFLAVVGASGSGKSSVVQAGLIAQLRPGKQLPGSDSWLIKSMRPGARPLAELARRLGEGDKGTREGGLSSSPQLVLEGMLYQGVEGFVYWLRSRPESVVVLVVDQFEELFTLAPGEDRQRFLELLLGAMEYAADKFKLVITLRADFIAACLEVPALASLLQESSILVPPNLSDRDYRRVIINPAEQVSLKVESELVEVLLQELNHSAGDLPLLEFVLEQLWEFRQDGKLTLAAYQQQVGGIKGALERKAQAVYESLDSPAQDCARWIFLSLTQLGEGTEDTRRRVWKSELVVQKYPVALVERTLQVLTAAKLVVVNVDDEVVGGDKGDKGAAVIAALPASAVTIEVAHEILIRHWSTLRWWLEENRSRLRSQRQIEQAAALWKHNQEQTDFLLQGIRLAEAEEIYIKYTDELSEDVQSFIAACLAERKRQQFAQKKRLRQAQQAIIVISVLGIAASGFGVFAYFQKQAAQLREISALNASSEALLLSNQQLEALIAGVKSGREVKQVSTANKDIQLTTIATLEQAVSQSQEINRLQGHSQQVNAVSFSHDGKIIASASDDGTIKLWRVDGKILKTITDNQRVTSLVFSPDDKLIAASTDKSIKLYNIDGKIIKAFTGYADIINSLDFSYDGKTLVSASRDKTIKLWRIDGTIINTWNAHNGWVNTVSFSPDSQIIVSGGEDNLVKLWRFTDGKLLQTLSGHKERITSVKFSPDGKIIASVSGDKTINLWNRQGKILQTIEGHTNQINSISFSPDGKMLATADDDAVIKIWQNQNPSQIEYILSQTFKGHGGVINSLSFSPDGKMIASASADKTVRIWEVNNLANTLEKGKFYSANFSHDNQMFAAAGWDGIIKIWQRNEKLIKSISGNKQPIYAVDFSPDNKIIAAASDDKTIKLWNIANNSLIHTFTGNSERVTSISFSPNGKILAAGSADKTIKIWQIADKKLLHKLTGHTDAVSSVSFSNDGKLLASGSYDNTVKLWRIDGSLVTTLQGNGLAIASVKFSPDNTILAAASLDNSIKLWNVANGTLIHTLTGHSSGVTSLSFLPHSQIIASGSVDGTIKLWNIRDFSLLKTLIGHPGKINSISFSPDGNTLISAGEDSGLKLWNLNLADLRQSGCLRIKNYLKNNPNVNESDRHICDN